MDSREIVEIAIRNFMDNDVINKIYDDCAQDITLALKKRTSELAETNAKMDSILTDLSLLNSTLQHALGRESYLQYARKDHVKDFSTRSLALSAVDKQRKENNYLSKMKICFRIFSMLNDRLERDLKIIKSQLKTSKTKLDSFEVMSKEELKSFEGKIKHYEQELQRYEKKYPWLSDEQLSLPNVAYLIKTLKTLREKKSVLLEELSKYRDLKPDIIEASHQLKMVRQEHKQLKSCI